MAFSRPLALVAAEREGFLAGESLAIKYSQSRGSAPQIAALLAGELDLVHTAVDNVVLRVDRDGADLVMVLIAELGISQRLVVRADIESIADLRGQILGVDAVDSGYATPLYAMLERRGIPLEKAAGVYEAEARSREVAAPTLEQQRASVARVVELRHPGETIAVDRYFDPA